MANKKISDLTAATSAAATDLALIETAGGNSRKIAVAQLSGLALITETVTAASATNVSFTSIPATYRDLIVRVRGRLTTSAVSEVLRMRFNGDSGANYNTHATQLVNVTPGGFVNVGLTYAYIGSLSAATATASYADTCEALIGDYRGTTFHKSGLMRSSYMTSAAASAMKSETGGFWWRSASAITQIDVFPAANAFVDGTVVSLYGLL